MNLMTTPVNLLTKPETTMVPVLLVLVVGPQVLLLLVLVLAAVPPLVGHTT